ncbi:amidohydrolase [Shewanella sp. 10N.286.54.B9]
MNHYIKRSKNQLIVILCMLVAPMGCAHSQQERANSYVFYGGDILTMERATYSAESTPEAMWVKNGIIEFLGNKDEVLKAAGRDFTAVDLEGKTLMPGFVEPHTHLPLVISFSAVTDLSPCLPEPYDFQYYKDDPGVDCPKGFESTFEVLNKSKKRQLDGTEWIVANGIDPSRMGNDPIEMTTVKAFIDAPAEILEKKVTDGSTSPIFLLDQSGHVAYVNRQAFIAAKICKAGADEICGPDNLAKGAKLPGSLGTWVVDAGGHFTGKLLEEPAYAKFMLAIIEALAAGDDEKESALETSPFFFMTKEEGLAKAPQFIEQLASTGITTIVNAGGFKESEVLFFKELAAEQNSRLRYRSLVSADIMASAEVNDIDGNKQTEAQRSFAVANRLRTPVWDASNKGLYGVYGVKLWVDGSTQGCSAYLAADYSEAGICQGTAGDKGANYSSNALLNALKPFWSEWQVQVHANGNSAMTQALAAFSTLQSNCGSGDAANKQPIVLHHATVGGSPEARTNIVADIAKYRLESYECKGNANEASPLDISVSHTSAHIAYWGGAFQSILDGKGQVEEGGAIEPDTKGRSTLIDPIAEETRLGIPYSLHSDVPVSPANPLWYVQQVVTRDTWFYTDLATDDAEPMPANSIEGKQNADIYQALRGITIVPAIQNQLENYIGSLEKGKVADLVILDKNPLKVAAKDIHSIRAKSTFVNGIEHIWIQPE